MKKRKTSKDDSIKILRTELDDRNIETTYYDTGDGFAQVRHDNTGYLTVIWTCKEGCRVPKFVLAFYEHRNPTYQEMQNRDFTNEIESDNDNDLTECESDWDN